MTILKALERMGYKGRMTGHGFRGLASIILHEQLPGTPNLTAGIDCTKTTDTEAFALSIFRAQQEGKSKRVVCLTGADMRGTIYAIYEFSQKYLGVDPMYL
jgi:hypothetical protein